MISNSITWNMTLRLSVSSSELHFWRIFYWNSFCKKYFVHLKAKRQAKTSHLLAHSSSAWSGQGCAQVAASSPELHLPVVSGNPTSRVTSYASPAALGVFTNRKLDQKLSQDQDPSPHSRMECGCPRQQLNLCAKSLPPWALHLLQVLPSINVNLFSDKLLILVKWV